MNGSTARALVRAAAFVGVALPIVLCACGGDGTAPSRARLTIDRASLAIWQGARDTLRATATDAAGLATNVAVTWNSADRSIITVDSTGAVWALAAGRTTITATAGTLADTVDVTVRADTLRPSITSVDVTPRAVDLAGGDAVVTVVVRARDQESGVRSVEAVLRHPSGTNNVRLNQYCFPTMESGSAADGSWRCTIPVHHFTAPGTWRLAVIAYDWRQPLSNFDTTSVAVAVANPRTDDTPPVLDELTLTPERINEAPYGDSRLISVTAHDAESGVLTVEYYLDADTLPGIYSCGAERTFPPTFPWQPSAVVTGKCPIPLVASAGPAWRTVSLVRMTDARGNVREMRTAELERAGIVTRWDIRK